MSRTMTIEQLNEAAMNANQKKKDPFSGPSHRLDEDQAPSKPSKPPINPSGIFNKVSDFNAFMGSFSPTYQAAVNKVLSETDAVTAKIVNLANAPRPSIGERPDQYLDKLRGYVNTAALYSGGVGAVGGLIYGGNALFKKATGIDLIDETKEKIKSVWRKVTTKKPQKTTRPSSRSSAQAIFRKINEDKIAQAIERVKENEVPPPPPIIYEEDSIRKIEAGQRARVPWKLPPIDVGITRMTGFEPFTAIADQTFNVFYGGGRSDPFY